VSLTRSVGTAYSLTDAVCTHRLRGSTIVLGLSQGGTVTVLYGLIGVAIVNMFIALSLGELSSAYPSAGGQYVYTAALAGPKSRRALSFVVAWVTVFEWITIVASVVFIGADIVFGLVEVSPSARASCHPDSTMPC